MGVNLTGKEEEKMKRYIFRKTGVIYLRTISNFYLSMAKEEMEKLKEHAKNLKINVEIKPNKVIFDKKKGAIIYDWFLNHKICPFYKGHACLVYEDRPVACREFPHGKLNYSQQVADFVKKNRIDFSDVSYEEAFTKCKLFCKSF